MSSPRKIAYTRGEELLNAIASRQNVTAIASQWTAFSDLAANEWVRGRSPNATLASFQCDEFFETIRLTEEGIVSIDWTHPANGVARYCHLFHVNEGTILCTDRVSPRGALNGANAALLLNGQPEPEPMPRLAFWSDVAWLQWEKLCQEKVMSVKGLQRIVFCEIKNKETNKIIDQVFGSGDQQYPGKMFVDGTDALRTLLGTVNGQGVGYLLSQHKSNSQLGFKYINQVQVFRGGEPSQWYMVFLLRDS